MAVPWPALTLIRSLPPLQVPKRVEQYLGFRVHYDLRRLCQYVICCRAVAASYDDSSRANMVLCNSTVL